MPITFAPRRGAILMCDFGPDPNEPTSYPVWGPPLSTWPEIWKLRRVVVVSPDSLNHRHGTGAGLCVVVPFSATKPKSTSPHDVFFMARSYRSLTKDVWASCASPIRVSHNRLDRPYGTKGYKTEFLSALDLVRISDGLRAAFGL